MDAHAWGIEDGYWDISGHRHDASSDTIASILSAMGAEGDGPPEPAAWIVHPGETHALPAPGVLETEDGGSLPVSERLPADLPLGYHVLRLDDRAPHDLIVSPGRCWLPAERIWGWSAQVYALRSAHSWGIGDLADLQRLARWSAGLGAGMTLINPLHSVDPTPEQPSPYFPGSRVWRNPLYIAVEDVPGARDAGLDLEHLAAEGRKLNGDLRIDRAEVYRVKDEALRMLHARFDGSDDYDSFCREGGRDLEDFATFCALAEEYGPTWREWPAELRDPSSPAVVRARRDLSRRVDLYRWLQWVLDAQLAGAGAETRIVQDLAIGVDPTGPDAWAWQRYFAPGVTVGAPPDDFNLEGQNWGVLAFDPWKLRSASYEPFVRTIRSVFRHSGGMRFDHVMGLWRLFWIPQGMGPPEGTYVRYQAPEMHDILALESHRARAFVVGEDLGTVEPGVREEMFERAMLSYKLMWFEPGPPSSWPELSLGAITNHDLPTIAGVWTGADLADQEAVGVAPNRAFLDWVRERIAALTGALPESSPAEVALALHRELAQAPSRVIAATLEDAIGVSERPNLPGTTNDRRANWSRALPLTLEEIEAHPEAIRIASILSGREAMMPEEDG